MFPEATDIPTNKAEFDKWLGDLPTSAFTPKMWYLIGVSHCEHSVVQKFATIFDLFYPIAVKIASNNVKDAIQ